MSAKPNVVAVTLSQPVSTASALSGDVIPILTDVYDSASRDLDQVDALL